MKVVLPAPSNMDCFSVGGSAVAPYSDQGSAPLPEGLLGLCDGKGAKKTAASCSGERRRRLPRDGETHGLLGSGYVGFRVKLSTQKP